MNKIIINISRIIPLAILIISLIGFVTLLCYPIVDGNTFWLLLWSCGIAAVISILFLLYDRWIGRVVLDTDILPKQLSTRTIRILDAVYYFGLSLLLAIVFFNEVRPYLYVFLQTVLAVLIVFQVLVSLKKSTICHALFKTIVLFSVSSLSIFKVYYWTGRDTWTHAVWNIQLAENGQLFAGLGKELSTPLYHVAVAVGELIPGLDVRGATILTVTIPLLLLVSLSVYSVAKLLVNPQYAVIAVVIADFIGFLPYWSTLGQSTTYACMLFAVLLIPLFRLFIKFNGKCAVWIFLFLGLVLSITLTHLYSTFILVLYLSGTVLTYLIIDCNKDGKRSSILAVFAGIIIAVGYSCFTQLPMMSRVFEIGFSKLGFVLESIGINTLQFLPSASIKESAVMNTIQQSLQNCFTLIVDENLWLFFWSSALKFLLLVVPFVIACMFIARRCCHLELSSFERSMWYLLLPAFMLFTLLVITSVAYPPMSDRPWYYLPMFQGLLFASVLWYYTAHCNQRNKDASSHNWVNIILVLSIVSVAVLGGGITILMNSDNPGIFKDEMINYGHTEEEIDGLVTVIPYLPEKSVIHIDNEMSGPVRYALELSMINHVVGSKNIMAYTPFMDSISYLIFRKSIIEGVTYYPILSGSSELDTEWNKYHLSDCYLSLLDVVGDIVYSNGDLVVLE